jgi:hypothetical protein
LLTNLPQNFPFFNFLIFLNSWFCISVLPLFLNVSSFAHVVVCNCVFLVVLFISFFQRTVSKFCSNR